MYYSLHAKLKTLLCGLILGTSLMGASLQAQTSYWSDVPEALVKTTGTRYTVPVRYRTLALNPTSLQQLLDSAPMEGNVRAKDSSVTISLPMPDGTVKRFSIVESPIMQSGLAAKYPHLKTYAGQGIDDPTATTRISMTPYGFHAMVRSVDGSVYIDPYAQHETNFAISYYGSDYGSAVHDGQQVCNLESSDNESLFENVPNNTPANAMQVGELAGRSGDELSSYRLALACTGEYAAFHGGTVDLALAAMVNSINRVNEVYETEVSVRLILIDNNDLLIELDGATDPYTNGNTGIMIGESQAEIPAVIGNSNFDIGHLFGTDSGGLASLNSVCNSGTKASGVTGSGAPIGDSFDVDYVCHEVGHQFGGQHTQNNTCNRSSLSAYEPGSASTIMGYAGICPPNLQGNSDPYFHVNSYDQIRAHVENTDCDVVTATGNNPPDVDAGGGGFVIPISTPFQLTGEATDPDGDALTYSWEQFDLGPATDTEADLNNPTGTAPIFRAWEPEDTPTRVFPRLSDLVNNTTAIGELLPTYERSMTFRFIARDNQMGGGGVDYDEIQFQVSAEAGPFEVLSPNDGTEVWAAGANAVVTWDVANTTEAPVSCSTVNLLLSVDGGLTYPFELATNVPNNGSANVLVPNGVIPDGSTEVTTCRVKVESVGNIFFDISNTNFTVQEPTEPDFTVFINDTSIETCSPTDVTSQISLSSLVGFADEVDMTVEGLPSGATADFGTNPVTPSALTNLIITPGTALPGTYDLVVTGTSGTLVHSANLQVLIALNEPDEAELIFPADDATAIFVGATFTWDPVPFATTYDIQIATDPVFVNIVQEASDLTGTSFTVDPNLDGEVEYFWHVKVKNACGESEFSPVFSFTTAEAADIPGCIDNTAFNYNPNATVDDGSCVPVIEGCTDPDAANYNEDANVDDGSCVDEIAGCTDETAFNYNEDATIDDGSCVPFINGCTDPDALNYDATANTDDGFCVEKIFGCVDETALNFDEDANWNDGSCEYDVYGCTDPEAGNYNTNATIDDGTCSSSFLIIDVNPTGDPLFIFDIINTGLPSISSVNWDFGDDGTGEGMPVEHTYSADGTYTVEATVSGPTAAYVIQTIVYVYGYGCTDPYAMNFDPQAVVDDGSCVPHIFGCMDENAENYDPTADIDNGSCIITACTYTSIESVGLWENEAGQATMFVNLAYTHPDGLAMEATEFTIALSDEDAPLEFVGQNTVTAGPFASGTVNTIPFVITNDISELVGMIDATGTLTIAANAGNCDLAFSQDVNSNVLGCTNPEALNYVEGASVNDGSCIGVVEGCTDPTAFNYDADANTDDGSCIPVVLGCTNPDAGNYNPAANTDDGSCILTAPDWEVTPTSSNHTILIPETAELSIGETQIEDGDFVGVFYEVDGEMICGGFVLWTEETTSIAAYGADTGLNNGFQNNEEFSWMFWDASENAYIEVFAEYNTTFPNTNTFQEDGVSGILTLKSTTIQEIPLVNGWNMISTYLKPLDRDIASVMSPVVNNMLLAKAENGDVYWPAFDINTIDDVIDGKAYKVRMNAPLVLEVSGTVIKPELLTLNLPTAWSYLGYPRTEAANIENVLVSIEDDILIVKNQAGLVYWPEFGVNNIGNMEPGVGYQISMQNSANLTFDANAVVLPQARFASYELAHYSKADVSENNMTIGIPVDAWDIMPNEGDELAVFDANNNLVGSTVYNGANTAFSVWSDDSTTDAKEGLLTGENFTIRYWNTSEEKEYAVEVNHWLSGSDMYEDNAISVAGSISLREASIETATALFQNVPNPFGTETEIRFYTQEKGDYKIALYNALGELIEYVANGQFEAGYHSVKVNGSKLSSGTYYYSLTGEQFTQTKRMTIVK